MIVDAKYRPELIAIGRGYGIMDHCLNVVESHAGVEPMSVEDADGKMKPGFVVATNGKLLLVVPCILEKGDVPGVVRWDLLKLGRQFKGKDGFQVKLGHKLVRYSPYGMIVPRLTANFAGKSYPDTSVVVPSGNEEPTGQICFGESLLTTLVSAIGKEDGLVFEFRGRHGITVVRPSAGGKKMLGLLMPMRV